jgi:endonuclease-3 related protein
MTNVLQDIYCRLFQAYGPQRWWPAKTTFEMMVGAVLTQSAAWTNVEKAIVNLESAGKLSPQALRETPQDELARLVFACGYYNAKAKKLKALAGWLEAECGDDLKKLFLQDTATLREKLLAVYGIGEETADSILLYAGNKPVFVIDAYTRRIIDRLGISPARNRYGEHQSLFMDNLPPDVQLFNEYHALLVKLGKENCRTQPRCAGCCLNHGGKTPSPKAPYPCAVRV